MSSLPIELSQGGSFDSTKSRVFKRIIKSTQSLMLSALSVGVFVTVWIMVTRSGWISPIFLPTPANVWAESHKLLVSGELWKAIGASSMRVFAGFALAAIVAIPAGILMGIFWPLRALGAPFISLLRPLPSIAWVPLTMLWLGIGESQKIAIVFLGSWIYIMLATLESTKQVDPILIRAARNLGASNFALMREVIFPGALPGIIAGMKMTLAISWACVLSAELVAAQSGLGALIWNAKEWGNLALVIVGMICISIVVLVVDVFAAQAEKILFPWLRENDHKGN
jgi:taurine transport system permease protein